MAHSRHDSSPAWPLALPRPLPLTGYPIGDVVAIMASSADAGRAVAMLAALGIAETSIEIGASPDDVAVLVVRRPGRERIAAVRRILRTHRARQARYYRVMVIEELVRVSARAVAGPASWSGRATAGSADAALAGARPGPGW
jgi:hypothetical protein